ncbi:MAG: hemerythrin domain-containing protein [Candidatus Bathyarchaeota archaeon]|nr:hemerythrin domain-containing protein [Candidatus Bathyarchaeota archaeon]
MEQIKSVFGRGPPEGSIYDMLKVEHRQIKASLQEILNSGRVMNDVFSQTATALDMHMKGEEALLYPKLEQNNSTRACAVKSREEHNFARMAIRDINNSAPDERWIAKVSLLYDVVSHHINEEENEVFPGARKVLTDTVAMQLGREYRTRTYRKTPSSQTPPQQSNSEETSEMPPVAPSKQEDET